MAFFLSCERPCLVAFATKSFSQNHIYSHNGNMFLLPSSAERVPPLSVLYREEPIWKPMNFDFTVNLVWWILASCCLVSFIEHQVHQQLMHKQNFLSKRDEGFEHVFKSHAIVHHGHYSQTFSDEPVPPGEDKEIRLNVHKAPIKTLPFTILIALISWQWAIVFVVTVCVHHWVWNKIHLEMHKPEGKEFSTWSPYLFLARHHYLHHVHPNKNFNVVFPFADYILGTNVVATPSERLDMHRLGLLPMKTAEVFCLQRAVTKDQISKL